MARAAAAAALIGLLAAGCATRQAPPPPRATVNIFISPAGEPFRAGAKAAYPLDVWFARADADHDGALSRAELLADAEAFFRRLDRDHDGVLSGFEVSEYEQTVAPEILPRIGGLTAADIPPLPDTAAGQRALKRLEQPERPARGRAGPGGRGAGLFSLTPEPEPVSAADTDFDGKVTQAEFLAAVGRRFDKLDLDHDGRLRRAELPATAAERLSDRALEAARKKRR